MARARNIKPGFFKNEDLAECTAWARLCFAGLWTIADRAGRLEDRPKRIKAELFPFDTVDVEPLLTELEKHGFITRYAAEGRGLIQILEFSKHQHPHHKEPESVFSPLQSPGLLLVATPPKPETSPASIEQKVPDKPEIPPPIVAVSSTQNPADSGIDESRERKTKTSKPKAEEVGPVVLLAAGFDAKTAGDFIAHKAVLKAPLTPRAWSDHLAEAAKAGWTPLAAAEKVMAKNWKGFEAKYVAGEARPAPSPKPWEGAA